MTWLVLLVSLPPHPSSLRVRTWRRLRALGAIPLKNSAYILPATSENSEQFQWLTQAVHKDGGEAILLNVERIETMKPDEVIGLFQAARNQDYRPLIERYRKVLQTLTKRKTAVADARIGADLARLASEVQRIKDVDFFGAPHYREIERLREVIEMRRTRRRKETATSAPAEISPATMRGRRWATRPRPHVDRVSSAWLIKRFIDADAQFVFAQPEEFPADVVPFDVLGAEFGHQGEDCTFETLVKRFGLHDAKLADLAEIIHEADLRDQKYAREEARGVDQAVRGLLAALKDDQDVVTYGLTLFDGLYSTLGEPK